MAGILKVGGGASKFRAAVEKLSRGGFVNSYFDQRLSQELKMIDVVGSGFVECPAPPRGARSGSYQVI